MRILGSLVLSWWAAAPVVAEKSWLAKFWEEKWTTVLSGVILLLLGIFLGEPLKALIKRLGERLDRAFQGFDWRFRKRYLAALAERHRWLKLIGVYNRADLHPPRLQEVYVSLRLASSGDEGSPRFGWNEVFGPEERRLVILGSPGAGKSTLLDYLVLVFTGSVRHPLQALLGKPFPLLARLRTLGAEGGPATLLDLLAQSTPLQRVPAGYPERQLRHGGCIVLLDGLDEVLDEQRHRRVVEEIERLVNEYPENRYVVTCRLAGWRNQLPGFRTYEIQEFDRDDVRRFLSAWYREVLRTEKVNALGMRVEAAKLAEAEARAYAEAQERSEALLRALSGNESLLRIASTPLLLSLVTLVHYHRVTDLPQGRAELYEQCLSILLELWDRQDKQLQVIGPSYKDKLLVLKAIAFHYLEADLLEADVATLETLVAPLLPRLKTPLLAPALIEQIHQRSGVLVEQALGRYGFAHRALHDYLAAASVVENERDALLLARAGVERWREVILIAVGLAPPERAAKLVEALLARDSASGAELEMAGLALAEDLQLGDDLRAEVKRRLMERLGREEMGATLGRLAGALMAADLEAARSWMEEVLRGRDGARKKRVLELLPELGEAHGKPLSQLLVRLIAAKGEELEIRGQAARALAALGAVDGAAWEVLAQARREKEPVVKAAATWAWCELGRWEELGLVRVPAGEFLMGSWEWEDSDEYPQHVLYLPTFYIGKAPVTRAQFRQFVGESGIKPKDAEALVGVAVHPVAWVAWHEALAYAAFQGLSLPSEAEWEKAARGTDGRAYPWGNEWVLGRSNTAERGARWWPRGKRGSTTPVGQFSPAGDSPYGCVDMAGNVWEWTRSLRGEESDKPAFSYPYVGTDGREDTQAGSQVLRVVRGGAFDDSTKYIRCASRLWFSPDFRVDLIGFRVVLSPFTLAL